MLEEGLIIIGVQGREKVLPLLTKYIEEIELFNPAYDLVKVKDRNELIIKHILDSLAPLSILLNLQGKTKPRRIADIGSGAGLPGIPLAICMPDADFILVERMGRRAGFLRDALAILGLPNVRVDESEMEKLPQKLTSENRFNIIVFRAFKPLEPMLLKGLSKLLVPGGVLAAYKGRRESIENEMNVLRAKGAGVFIDNCEIIPLEVPFLDEERHLVLMKLN
jgi:16S rRNA (guanine527-N7)-methyltransferase